MPLKRRNGRDRIVSTPQRASEGRRAPIAPAVVVPIRSPSDALVVLGAELFNVEQARAIEASQPSPESTDARRRAEKRRSDVRYALSRYVGPESADAHQRALQLHCGAVLRLAGKAPEGMREHVLLAAVEHAQVAVEHRIESTAARIFNTRSALWSALTRATLAEAVLDPAARGEAVKLARYADQCARLDLLTALQLERQARDGQRPTGPVLDERTIRAAVERAEQQALASAPPDDEDDEDQGDEDEDDEPEGTPAPPAWGFSRRGGPRG